MVHIFIPYQLLNHHQNTKHFYFLIPLFRDKLRDTAQTMGQEYSPQNEINEDYEIHLSSFERTLLAILVKRRVNKTPPTSGKHSGTILNEIVKVQGGEQCTSQGLKDVNKVQKNTKKGERENQGLSLVDRLPLASDFSPSMLCSQRCTRSFQRLEHTCQRSQSWSQVTKASDP